MERKPHEAIATLLDPRFKNVHFQEPIAVAQAMSRLRNTIRNRSENTNSGQPESQSNATEDTENSEDNCWSFHYALARRHMNSHFRNTEDVTKDELAVYQSNPLLPLTSDPIKEWNKLKRIFATLYEEAIKHLYLQSDWHDIKPSSEPPFWKAFK